VLARQNRLLSADDFRVVLRRGRRVAAGSVVVSIMPTSDDTDARFGFIVTKKVGNAVSRNKVRRRMRAIARELVDGGLTGMDVVVRAAPSASDIEWARLRSELRGALSGEPRL
jgi:ribonuclease P protein component